MVSVTHTGQVHRWKPGTNQRIGPVGAAQPTEFLEVQYAVFSPSGRLVAVNDGCTTLLKETATGKTLRRLEFPPRNFPLAISPDDKTLAMSAREGISLFDTATGKELACFAGRAAAAFSSDGRQFAWRDGHSIFLERMPILRPDTIRPQPDSDPPGVPLRAEWIVKQDTYLLDLGGLTPEEFSEEAAYDYLPSPSVNLSLRLRNTGGQSITIEQIGDQLISPSFCLAGKGAINPIERWRQSGVGAGLTDDISMPNPVILAPGASHDIPVSRLGERQGTFWILPGEYTLHATCALSIKPAPKTAKGTHDHGWVELTCRPIRLKVVSARKTSTNPLVRTLDMPALGSPVAPRSAANEPLRLWTPVAMASFFAKERSLQETVAWLRERFDTGFPMEICIDESAFRKIGKERIGAMKCKPALPDGTDLGAALRALLEPLRATFEVRKRSIWIVPLEAQESLSERLPIAERYQRVKLNKVINFEPGIPKPTPFAKALWNLNDRFRINLVIDHSAFQRAGIKDIDGCPVKITEQGEIYVGALLQKLLPQVGATFAPRAEVVLIVPGEEPHGK
jgi:hypothetical protein